MFCRCQRLDKECRQPPSHKRQSTRQSARSKAARLEEKLEDLVELLRAGVQPPAVNPITNALSTPNSSFDVLRDNATQHTVLPPIPTTLTPDTNVSEPTSRSPAAFSTPGEPTSLQAEECLATFRSQLLPYFPCIHISPDMTAQRLRERRPFTWLCIMSVTSKSASQRRALNDRIKATVAQEMVHNSASTDIDILLGLLIYLGWYFVLSLHSVSPTDLMTGQINKYTTRQICTFSPSLSMLQFMSSVSITHSRSPR